MTQKEYNVSFDMKYSYDFNVTANTPGEAKRKAFAKFKSIRAKQSSFNIYIDKL